MTTQHFSDIPWKAPDRRAGGWVYLHALPWDSGWSFQAQYFIRVPHLARKTKRHHWQIEKHFFVTEPPGFPWTAGKQYCLIYIYTFPLRTSPLIPVGHHGSSNILSIFVGNRVPHGTAGWSCFPYPSRIAIKPTDGWSIKKPNDYSTHYHNVMK